jgi:fructose-1-phosphate kinase PfkB-like protein
LVAGNIGKLLSLQHYADLTQAARDQTQRFVLDAGSP